MQTALHLSGGELRALELPSPDEIVSGNTRWGRHEELCTPAYWAAQAWIWQMEEPQHYRLGETLEEELLACLLGGYGIPAEVGLAAYRRLRPLLGDQDAPLLDARKVYDLLMEPLIVRGRSVRYRFPNQKARAIALALAGLENLTRPVDNRGLRRELLKLEGVGPKTASWIVRNFRASDDVAILDVHIVRAGNMLGIFRLDQTVQKHYFILEEAYLEFAKAIGVRASILDSVMWMAMRGLPTRVLEGMMSNPALSPAESWRTSG